MFEFKIYIIAGFILLLLILIYELYIPFGKEYSNAFEIIGVNNSQYNIPNLENSSLFIINPKNSTITFYKNSYNLLLSPFIKNIESFKLYPLNKTTYSFLIDNETCYSPIIDNNITFYYNPFNNSLTTRCFNKSLNNYVFESFNVNMSSLSSSNKYTLIILYNENVSYDKPFLIYNKSSQFYKTFNVSCKSNQSKFIYLFDDFGNKSISYNGVATLNILAYPNLVVTCYDGNNYIKENINFTKSIPDLNLTYKNNKTYCKSDLDTELYMEVDNKTIFGIGSVSYIGNLINTSITCTQPGNQYQEKATKTINIT